MADWKRYLSTDFAGCMLLAYAHDQHRGRDVRIYRVPGAEDAVGVTDGVDRWIAPVVESLFSVNVLKIMRDLYDGIMPKPTPPKPRTRVPLIVDAEAPRRRIRLSEQATTTTGGRSRVSLI